MVATICIFCHDKTDQANSLNTFLDNTDLGITTKRKNLMSAFPEISKIKYEGPESTDLLSYRWYNAEEVIE
ncbi:MAG: hypothetical protein OSA92_12550, partial [Pirellulaceae bacterium]|nr:hypothetical protein [Pirellulaceae bacterium]